MFLIRTRFSFDPPERYLTVGDGVQELAFQHIEQQFNCLLSPSVTTPNILSKGKLNSRSVNVPLSLYGLYEEPEAVPRASEEPPNWSCGVKDGEHTLVVIFSVPRLVCPPFFFDGHTYVVY